MAVRDLYMALVQEALNRYDSDGLELDFMRAPYLFRPGHELEGGQILTGWLTQVRQLAVAAGRKRGHPVKLGVRVPTNPVTAYNLGLDAALWAQRGLVDLVTVAPWFDSMDSDVPMFLWKRLLSPYPATGTRVLLRLQTGPRPAGRTGTLVVVLKTREAVNLKAPELRVNGSACQLRPNADGSAQTGKNGVFVFLVPDTAFVDAVQLLELSGAGEITVNRVVLWL